MKSIPRAAMPVVRVLRRDVKRPKVPRADTNCFGPGDVIYWQLRRWGYSAVCPMGLHPGARRPKPATAWGFPLASDRAVRSAARWWDSLTRKDIPAAMDAIWGPK